MAQYVTRCVTCQMAKTPYRLPADLLQPLPIPQCPWSHVAVDFVTDLPLTQSKTVILSVIDLFFKACCLLLLPKLSTAFETAEQLLMHVFRHYGLPEETCQIEDHSLPHRSCGRSTKGLESMADLTVR